MQRLKDSATTPPGGWKFYVADTRYTVFGGSEDELNGRVTQHLRANKLPVPKNLRLVIQDQICSHGLTSCKDLSPEAAQKKQRELEIARTTRKCPSCGGGKNR